MKEFPSLPGGVPTAFRPVVKLLKELNDPLPIGVTCSQYVPGPRMFRPLTVIVSAVRLNPPANVLALAVDLHNRTKDRKARQQNRTRSDIWSH